MKLYEINSIIQNAIEFDEETGDMLNPETGEIFTEEEFNDLQISREEKIDNILCWMRNLEADEKAYAEEEARFKAKKTQAKNKRERLKSFTQYILNGEKFKNEHFSVSYRRSEKVEVADIKAIPSEFLKIKEPEADKMAIKKAIKDGAEVPGVRLEENVSMIIK